ncbi:hypothetical protein OPV22_030165 [Ensete ventricosum]|uniref:Uncharacterized protein n=1 Tax=Ensete ventricosum TaxID=4639 RepID=A0AAV8QDA7_ENSVE|nr:hypothetical protein OPV22_030165 [Ensete ventricosum]
MDSGMTTILLEPDRVASLTVDAAAAASNTGRREAHSVAAGADLPSHADASKILGNYGHRRHLLFISQSFLSLPPQSVLLRSAPSAALSLWPSVRFGEWRTRISVTLYLLPPITTWIPIPSPLQWEDQPLFLSSPASSCLATPDTDPIFHVTNLEMVLSVLSFSPLFMFFSFSCSYLFPCKSS